jgi:hypothetical protein
MVFWIDACAAIGIKQRHPIVSVQRGKQLLHGAFPLGAWAIPATHIGAVPECIVQMGTGTLPAGRTLDHPAMVSFQLTSSTSGGLAGILSPFRSPCRAKTWARGLILKKNEK